MRALILAITFISTQAFSAPAAKTVKCKEAMKAFTSMIPLGKYEGEIPGKGGKCVVELTKGKNYFTVEVDDLSDSISIRPESNCVFEQSKSSVVIITEDSDGDESVGGYTFTKTSRVTFQKGGLMKVSEIEVKDYLDVDYDSETEIRSCIVDPR